MLDPWATRKTLGTRSPAPTDCPLKPKTRKISHPKGFSNRVYIAFFLSTSIFLYPVGQKFRRCFVVPDVGNRLPAVDSFVLARVCAHRTSNKDANNVKCDQMPFHMVIILGMVNVFNIKLMQKAFGGDF